MNGNGRSFQILTNNFEAVQEGTRCTRNVGLTHVQFFNALIGRYNAYTPIFRCFKLERLWKVLSRHQRVSFGIDGPARCFDVHVHPIRIRCIVKRHHTLERCLFTNIVSGIWSCSESHLGRYVTEEGRRRPPEAINEPMLLNHHRIDARFTDSELLRHINA